MRQKDTQSSSSLLWLSSLMVYSRGLDIQCSTWLELLSGRWIKERTAVDHPHPESISHFWSDLLMVASITVFLSFNCFMRRWGGCSNVPFEGLEEVTRHEVPMCPSHYPCSPKTSLSTTRWGCHVFSSFWTSLFWSLRKVIYQVCIIWWWCMHLISLWDKQNTSSWSHASSSSFSEFHYGQNIFFLLFFCLNQKRAVDPQVLISAPLIAPLSFLTWVPTKTVPIRDSLTVFRDDRTTLSSSHPDMTGGRKQLQNKTRKKRNKKKSENIFLPLLLPMDCWMKTHETERARERGLRWCDERMIRRPELKSSRVEHLSNFSHFSWQ